MCVSGCVCLTYLPRTFIWQHHDTPRTWDKSVSAEDSIPSEDPNTDPRKTLAKNTENIMFYHLRGVSAPRTSMDFKNHYIYEDTRVLGSISNSRVCVWGVFNTKCNFRQKIIQPDFVQELEYVALFACLFVCLFFCLVTCICMFFPFFFCALLCFDLICCFSSFS